MVLDYVWLIYNTLATEPLRSSVKVEVAVLGSPSLIVRTISDLGRKATLNTEQGEHWSVSRHTAGSTWAAGLAA